MLKLIIGNRTYSSWSLRGWLACKLSGLPFDTEVIPMDTLAWENGAAKGLLPADKVPVLWDGDIAVWDSLAITDWLAERAGNNGERERFWPADPAASALARSMTAEMHSGFQALRSACAMNLQRDYPDYTAPPEVLADVARIDALWTDARTRVGDTAGNTGPFLFGGFSAADVMYAPVATRCKTFGLPLSDIGAAYVAAVLAHPWLVEWTAAARAETYPFNRDYAKSAGGLMGGVPAR